jgi:hypothetical protein
VQFTCGFTPNFTIDSTLQGDLEKVAKQKKWPAAYIFRIEPSGLMLVKFNQKMKIPDHPSYIQNETVVLNEHTYPILKLDVLPGK